MDFCPSFSLFLFCFYFQISLVWLCACTYVCGILIYCEQTSPPPLPPQKEPLGRSRPRYLLRTVANLLILTSIPTHTPTTPYNKYLHCFAFSAFPDAADDSAATLFRHFTYSAYTIHPSTSTDRLACLQSVSVRDKNERSVCVKVFI